MYLVLVSAHRLYQAQMMINIILNLLSSFSCKCSCWILKQFVLWSRAGTWSLNTSGLQERFWVSNLVFNVGSIPGSGPDGASEFTIIM